MNGKIVAMECSLFNHKPVILVEDGFETFHTNIVTSAELVALYVPYDMLGKEGLIRQTFMILLQNIFAMKVHQD